MFSNPCVKTICQQDDKHLITLTLTSYLIKPWSLLIYQKKIQLYILVGKNPTHLAVCGALYKVRGYSGIQKVFSF